MSIYRAAVRKSIQAAENHYYHSSHNRLARQLIRSMASVSGGRRRPAMFKQCDDYARDVLGSLKYSPWLQAYSVFSGTFKEGWMPDNYFGKVVIPRINSDEISQYKPLSGRLLQTDLLPDLVYSVNGLLYTPAMVPVRRTELEKCLFRQSERVVFKLDGGFQGRSVFVYDIDSFPDESVAFGNGVFQSYIAQHPFFDAFADQSVSTVRITTVVDDELNVSSRAAYLRLPRSADTHVKSATAVKVAINHDGELHERGCLPNWVSTAHHPDSETPFAGQVVPHFQECVAACVSLHKNMVFSRVIGWDVIVDKDEKVVIMEWNGGHNDIKFSEAATGPCFADLGWQNLWRVSTE